MSIRCIVRLGIDNCSSSVTKSAVLKSLLLRPPIESVMVMLLYGYEFGAS